MFCFVNDLLTFLRHLANGLIEYSAPCLLNTAPLGGLKPLPVQRSWWVGSTILITACNELYFADSSLLGTLSVVRDYEAITYQVTTSFFTSREPSQTSETRMSYTMLAFRCFYSFLNIFKHLAIGFSISSTGFTNNFGSLNSVKNLCFPLLKDLINSDSDL